MSFLDIFYLFVFYSFFGWVIETTLVSIRQKHPVNIGLLDGPFSPIYGIGALSIIFFVYPFQNNLLFFLILSIITTSVLEYLTSLFFEKVFHVIWWNYSKEPFNLNGRICLEASIYWGILSVLVLTFIQPQIFPFIRFLSYNIGSYGILIFLMYFFMDTTNMIKNLLKVKNQA